MCRAIPARSGGKAVRILSVILLLSLLGACAAPQYPPPPPTAAVVSASPEESEGARLYRQNCAGCHRPLAQTTKPDRSASRIHSAIRHFQVMRFLESLSIEEIRSIAEALNAQQVSR